MSSLPKVPNIDWLHNFANIAATLKWKALVYMQQETRPYLSALSSRDVMMTTKCALNHDNLTEKKKPVLGGSHFFL
jgi:hypothetical protein